MLIDRFKTYLTVANRDYAQFAEEKKRREDDAARARLQQQISREERRSKVLKGITF